MAFNKAHHFIIEKLYAIDNRHQGQSGLNLLLNSACPGAAHQSGERHDPPKCHPGTRRAVIDEIMDWVDSEERERKIMWLSGPAGVGKSSIAQTIAERCDSEGKLVSSFFFSRIDTSTGRDDGNRLVPTIAYHLSIAIPATMALIVAALERDPAMQTYAMKVQLQRLVIDPLKHISTHRKNLVQTHTPKLLIIDGLDECNDRKVQGIIIEALAWMVSQPSVHLRILIASRPEFEIRNVFDSFPLRRRCVRLVLDGQYAPDKDIEIYLRSQFTIIKKEHTLTPLLSQDVNWPSCQDIAIIVQRSSGQFIYASTIINYIMDDRCDPRERLRAIVDRRQGGHITDYPYAELDAVYTLILETAAEAQNYGYISTVFMALLYVNDKREDSEVFLPAPGAEAKKEIASIYTVSRLAMFLGLPRSLMELLLMDLHSIVCVPGSRSFAEDGHFIRFYHASFGEFLQDPSRSKNFFIAKEKAHVMLGKHCFWTILAKEPTQQPYGSDLGYVLRYALHNYFYHLQHSIFDDELLHGLQGLENAREIVQDIILGLDTEEIEDILILVFKFDFTVADSSVS
ncbi:hypothetical protein BDQ17DRAFT_1536788 [Cyathus striatus]|nr:hypothetical protein BDQ17DRAFT_1536788 [Cyathus striatus]